MQGKIIKGISGFYYVHVEGEGIYECKAKGGFRRQKIRPLVGDDVIITVLDSDERLGNIEKILPRSSTLVRPAVANIDMALVIFAAKRPQPNLNLLDRFLCWMEYQKIPITICFNKCDLVTEEEKDALRQVYGPAGYPVIFTSAVTGCGVDRVRQMLQGRTTSVAGPSGVGKSSLINSLLGESRMETGAISEKIERGKHTTRHSEILPVAKDSYIMDTPGFSSLELPDMDKQELWRCYPEFRPYEPYCKFGGCSHISEPECGVKDALERGKIHRIRYDNYVLLYEECKNIRKY